MANIPTNFEAIIASAGNITGSWSGFTTCTSPVTFSALVDGKGNNLGAVSFPAGVTIPLTVQSASFTGGPLILYP